MPIGKLFDSIKEKFEGKKKDDKKGLKEKDDPMEVDEPTVDPFEGDQPLIEEEKSKNISENLGDDVKEFLDAKTKFDSFYSKDVPEEKMRRFLTHLSTDKPIYREKERVYFRGVVLNGIDRLPVTKYGDQDGSSHKPTIYQIQSSATLTIFSPSGDQTFNVGINCEDSVVAGFWDIPEGQSGGDYKAVIDWNVQNFPPAEREFNIRAFRNPRIKTQIKFEKKGYGAGDLATATLNVKRAEGDVPTGASISATARIDGVQVWSESGYTLDPKGDVSVSFKLPEKITTGDGTLSFVITDGGVVENASQTIPILLQTMDVKIYAEGGDFVSGIKNRFYVEAFTKTGDPADITAEVIEKSSGRVVGRVETVHEGRGKSFLVPEVGQEYELKVIKPSGVLNAIPFPRILAEGIALSSLKDTFKPNEPVEVAVTSSEDYEEVRLSLFKVDLELSSVQFSLKKGETKGVKLPSLTANGVLRVTAFLKSKPVAERIIYKHSDKKLVIQLKPEKASLGPGKQVKLHVKTSDEKGKPVVANVGITVADDSVLEMVEKRKQVPRLPEMALLENEVDHLFDCPFYFDPKEDNSNVALDLLLGTQGWRRFVLDGSPEEREQKIENKGRRERLELFHKAEKEDYYSESGSDGEFLDEEEDMEDKMEMEIEEAPARILQDLVMPRAALARKVEGAPVELKEAQPDAKMEAIIAPPVAREQPAEKLKAMAAPKMQMAMKQDRMEMKKKIVMKDVKEKRMKEEAAPRQRRVQEWIDDECDEDDDFCIPRRTTQTIVREYAFQARKGRKIGERTDFKETLYWNANLKTDVNGRSVVSFYLNDSVTSFKAWADGFTNGGHLGSSNVLLESREPFYLEPKCPLEVSSGDIIQLPIALANTLTEQVGGILNIELEGKGLKLSKDASESEFTLRAEERKRKLVKLDVLEGREKVNLTIKASSKKSEHVKDSVTRSIKVVPTGFPFRFYSSGNMEPGQTVAHTFELPKEFVEGTMSTEINFYPSPASKLSEALKSLIRNPSGCFEQTSTTTYPLVMALQYFESQPKGSVDQNVIGSARKKLEDGYKRLAGYECKKGGFEWFGSDPGHEALTAYGLMQFSEMKNVITIDSGMVERTQKWLMERRNEDGSFKRNSRALDSFGGAPAEHTDAYITWALTEAGLDTSTSVDYVIENCAKKKKDAYVWALTSISLYRLKRVEQAQEWARKIAELQKEDGSVTDEATSITRSGGQSLIVETTALSLLAWMSDPQDTFVPIIAQAGKYLISKCKGGSFGSTQATLLALKAILAFDKNQASQMEPVTAVVSLNGKKVGSVENVKPSDTISIPDFGSNFKSNQLQNEIKIEMTKGIKLPYSVTLDFYCLKGDTSEMCQVRLQTKLNDTKLKEGSGTEVEVLLQNISDQSLPMTLAVVGIPGGLEVRVDKLKELVKEGAIDFYEILGRRVALYWRYLAPKVQKKILLDVVAAVPGTYTGPASNAYLYYTDEFNWWNQGLQVEIEPK